MNIRLQHFARWINVGIVMATLIMSSSIGRAEEYTLNHVRAAWDSRQAAVRSFDCQWHEQWIVEKGYWYDPTVQQGASVSSFIPPEDVEFEARVRFQVKGNKYRCEVEEQIWSAEERSLVPRASIATSDGIKACIYYPVSDGQYPDATINPVAKDVNGSGLRRASVILLYRPFAPRLGALVLENFRIVGQPVQVNGDAGIVIETRQNKSGADVGFKSFQLSPTRGFAVTSVTTGRYHQTKPPKIGTQLDIMVTTGPDGLVRPSSWRYRQRAGHGHGVIVQATVNYCKLNEPLDDQLFSQGEFASGTWVTDSTGKEVTRWLVRENGKVRPILRADFGAPYEDIKNSEPGQAAIARASWYRGLPFIAINALIFAALVIWFWRTRRKTQVNSY
jgi:hypothetical protein